ncbi:CvpA family protein [Lentilactobacillus hilgardii]|uniref:CvpA family protein n=1 Tax=Lentilactobacillus hilgardii TaxID=1588 RepID=A0A6P1E9C5_LENHI|nr:CvpA family protein [Lentilactobacillus hilgardii ATCC 27305]MCT3390464.1 CvpA family protein [Lentilactobacillus hilgardii]QHB52720.1 CvpA family protein [Lentilactobacillus hilgardii]RRG09299.1 MAG: CvpA family protein [Lactobacillus sp.]
MKREFKLILDLIIIVLLIGGLISGYRAGFINQSVRIVSLILSFMVAIYYFQPTANIMINIAKKIGFAPGIQWLYVSDIVAFVLLFALTHAVYIMLGSHLNGIAKVPGFHLGNSLLGSVIGGITQYLIIFFVLNILIVFPISWVQDQYQESQISQTIVKKTPILSKRESRTQTIKQGALSSSIVFLNKQGGSSNEVD